MINKILETASDVIERKWKTEKMKKGQKNFPLGESVVERQRKRERERERERVEDNNSLSLEDNYWI